MGTVLVVPILEIWVAALAIRQFGWAAVIVVAALVFGFGIAMIRRALAAWASQAQRASQDAVYRSEHFTGEFASSALLLFGGILMAIPGFITATIGFFLVFPPTRALSTKAFSSQLGEFATERGFQRVTVIEGETVSRSSSDPSTTSGDGSQRGTVIIGEIVSGPDADTDQPRR